MPPRTRTPVRPPEHEITGQWMYVSGIDAPLDFTFGTQHVDIRDIAHNLSLINRYNGNTGTGLSVAEHSVRVSEQMDWTVRKIARRSAKPIDKLVGLLHDAAKAYIGDIARPLKNHPDMSYVLDLEEHITGCILSAYKLSPTNVTWRAARRADGAVFQEEWHEARGGNWGPVTAERGFLTRFNTLLREHRLSS